MYCGLLRALNARKRPQNRRRHVLAFGSGALVPFGQPIPAIVPPSSLIFPRAARGRLQPRLFWRLLAAVA